MFPWFGKAKGGVNIDDLVARKRYGQAIEALRERFRQKSPNAAERHQFAEVLILAKRGEEAIPILLGLADEHARFGFALKAREALGRIEELDPGRADVAERLAALAAATPEPEAQAGGSMAGVSWLDDSDAGCWVTSPATEAKPAAEATPEAEPRPEAEAPAKAEGAAFQKDGVSFDEELAVHVDPLAEDESDAAPAVEPEPALFVEAESVALEPASEPPLAIVPFIDFEPDADEPNRSLPGAGEASLLEFVRSLTDRATEEEARTGLPLLAAALLGGLADAQLQPLLSGLHRRRHAAGDVVLTEGENGSSVFLVASGGVKVFIRSAHGSSFEVDRIAAPGFFGEVAALSGRPRESSFVAASATVLLEIEKHALDALALARPAARQLLEEAFVARATSPAVAAVRSVPEDVAVERAAVVLAAHFGERRWTARMRLRLADVLLKAGNEKDAVAILTGVAEDLAAAGRADKAIAVLMKIEKIANRDVEELCLAPLARVLEAEDDEAAHRTGPHTPAVPEDAFRGWLFQVLGDMQSEAESPDTLRIDLAPLRRPAN
jgi:CRP-like cAMP-binding protein